MQGAVREWEVTYAGCLLGVGSDMCRVRFRECGVTCAWCFSEVGVTCAGCFSGVEGDMCRVPSSVHRCVFYWLMYSYSHIYIYIFYSLRDTPPAHQRIARSLDR